jgi:rubrerythrin
MSELIDATNGRGELPDDVDDLLLEGVMRPFEPRRLLSEFRCAGCGYGASCQIAPERCPMCGGSAWDFVARR